MQKTHMLCGPSVNMQRAYVLERSEAALPDSPTRRKLCPDNSNFLLSLLDFLHFHTVLVHDRVPAVIRPSAPIAYEAM